MSVGNITRSCNYHTCVNDSFSSRRQISLTFGPYSGLGPYIALCNTLTLIVSECHPVVFNVILAYIVHSYRVVCILVGTCIYI